MLSLSQVSSLREKAEVSDISIAAEVNGLYVHFKLLKNLRSIEWLTCKNVKDNLLNTVS